MSKSQSQFSNWLQYAALRSVTSLVHSFDVNSTLKSAATVGRLMYKIDGRRRKRAIYNLRISFPELSEAEVKELAKKSLSHFFQLGVEVLYTTRMITMDTWPDLVKITNMQAAAKAMLDPKGAVLVTGHYGNWEILGYLLATLGVETHAIARPIDNPLVNRWLLSVRERQGLKIVTKFGATNEVTSLLDNGEIVGFIGDQDAGPKGMFVPYFNRLASAYKSVGLMAINYDIPVICGYAHRMNNRFEFDAGIEDVIYPEDWKDQPDPLYYISARYTRALENMVRRDPHQYFWIHRRWKSRPRYEERGTEMPRALREQLEALPWMDGQLMDRINQNAKIPSGQHPK